MEGEGEEYMVRMQKLADGTDDEENSSEGKEPTKRTSPPFLSPIRWMSTKMRADLKTAALNDDGDAE